MLVAKANCLVCSVSMVDFMLMICSFSYYGNHAYSKIVDNDIQGRRSIRCRDGLN